MTTQENSARVHRFRDSVAVHFSPNHETAYLSAALARQLSEELARYAADIRDVPRFSESRVGTITLGGEEIVS